MGLEEQAYIPIFPLNCEVIPPSFANRSVIRFMIFCPLRSRRTAQSGISALSRSVSGVIDFFDCRESLHGGTSWFPIHHTSRATPRCSGFCVLKRQTVDGRSIQTRLVHSNY